MSAAPNASAMTPEQRDAAFAMAGQEMEYRVELFNKCVSCHRPSLIARLDVSSRSRRTASNAVVPLSAVSSFPGNLRLQKARTR